MYGIFRYFNVGSPDNENRGMEAERRLFDRIVKYTGVFGSVQGVTMLVTLVINKVKSTLLGTAGYGITESLNRNIDLIRNSTNLGISTVAVPEISHCADDTLQQELSDKIMLTRSWALLTALAGMVVCLILAPFLSRWAFDGDSGYTVSFMVLSLAVAATAVMGGETAIMKGTGMLREIALSQLLSGLVSLCISIPLFWWLRYDGIVPVIALTAIGGMAATCFFSCRRFSYRVRPFAWDLLRKGTGMIGFGIFYTVAAFIGAWAWSFIARYLTAQGGDELTGTYSAGYMLVTYLTNLLLSVTDSEYYPRLSAACNDMDHAHRLMNNQALAMCMIAAPVVILFMICLPVVVFVVLEYEKFYASILLAQMAVIGLYFKAVCQPIAYVVLARSDSRIFLLQETICYILLIICIVTGYSLAGTMGIGISMAVLELLYLLLVLLISRIRYGFVMSGKLVRNFLAQGGLVAVAAASLFMPSRWGLAIGTVACVMSLYISFGFLKTHTTFLPSFLSGKSRKS